MSNAPRAPSVAVVGGGPAGLYFGILMRQAYPDAAITIRERNRPGDTFGFGVVFSDETLGFLEQADPISAAAIRARFRSWRAIETRFRGSWTRCEGHGFCALARTTLLEILTERARELGCVITSEDEVSDFDALAAEHDLVIGSDGVRSLVRANWAASFAPRVSAGETRFAWLGTTRPLDAFTFLFEESPHGLFQVHAYPYAEGRATFIVETHEDTWRRAGLAAGDGTDDAATVALCEEIFADWLDGRRLLANRSIWRRFPTIHCGSWRHRNVVLLGDAAHTAHFSIGSGTKLAMEDAIALVEALSVHGTADIPAALDAYEAARRPEVERLQRAARTSRRWFETSRRYLGQDPLTFTFNLMTRSNRVTWENLRTRDPELVDRVDRAFAVNAGHRLEEDEPAPPPLFVPFVARGLVLPNRLVVSPMCQYSAVDGTVDDWHLVHLGSRAIGGAGLVIAEMTDVAPEGRITLGCAGLWRSEHTTAWRRIVHFVQSASGAHIGIQLAHAGRKASMRHPWNAEDVPLGPEEGAWEALAPSALPFRPEWPVPRAMTRADMERVRDQFVAATARAVDAGFDWLELHAAHGYLLSSFLSPLANVREDDWGGSLENRMRFPLEVFAAVRAAWPASKPMSVRVSASDWMPDESGTTPEETVVFARELRRLGCDVVDVSSAGNSPLSEVEFGRMYQVPFADQIRHEAGVPVMAVGGLLDADHATTVLAAGRADLAAIARAHLADPYLGLHAATRWGVEVPWPGQYLRGKPKPRRPPGPPSVPPGTVPR